ncbi:MAG TPA: hypothetical protein VNA13_02960, partial [Xanthomonadales bacterium]|nr:hypothetical protein [Xanthomonadales bacterium]
MGGREISGQGDPRFTSGKDWMKGLLTNLRSGERPIDHFLAKSLEEIYSSGEYRSALFGASTAYDFPRTPLGMRIVAVREGRLVAPVVMFDKPKNQQKLFERMKGDVERLPGGDLSALVDPALEALRAKGLQTAATLLLNRDLRTGRVFSEVGYPKVFREITAGLQGQFSDLQHEFGLEGIAESIGVPKDFLARLVTPDETMKDD